MIDIARTRRRLETRRREIEEARTATAAARRPVELDQARVGRLSRADAIQDQSMSLETDRRRETELKRLDAALARIDSGDYGICLACGEEIEARRLTFDPAAPTCVSCAG